MDYYYSPTQLTTMMTHRHEQYTKHNNKMRMNKILQKRVYLKIVSKNCKWKTIFSFILFSTIGNIASDFSQKPILPMQVHRWHITASGQKRDMENPVSGSRRWDELFRFCSHSDMWKWHMQAIQMLEVGQSRIDFQWKCAKDNCRYVLLWSGEVIWIT